MRYINTLNNIRNVDEIYAPEKRAENIALDIREVLSDGTVFGELIANSVGETLAFAIEKSGLDQAVIDGILKIKEGFSKGVEDFLKSDEFVAPLSNALATKQMDREMVLQQDNQQGKSPDMG